MKIKLTRWLSLILIIIIFFFNTALGMNQLESPVISQIYKDKQQASIQGSIIAAESNMPLKTSTLYLNNEQLLIKDGAFTIEDLEPGVHLIKIEAPFRKTYTGSLVLEPGANHVSLSLDTVLTEQEIQLLARITRAEAEGESELGRTAVAATVLNRLLSNKYPDTVQEVIYQKLNGRYQYSPVYDGRINVNPRPADYKAAYLALAGHDPSQGATGFFNPAKTRDAWVHSRQVTTQIGGHRFFIY